MITRKRWSSEEDQVIIDLISKNPNNLKKAFREASIALNRSVDSCRIRWYSNIIKNKNTPTCFITISKKTKSINSKNGKTAKNTISLWKKLLNLLKLK